MQGKNTDQLILLQVDFEQAKNLLSKNTWYKKELPIVVERLNLPGYLYKVTVKAGKSFVKSEYIIVEAIAGEFSFIDNIKFDTNLSQELLPSFILDSNESAQIAGDNYKQFLTARNLKTKVGATILSIVLESRIYYPLWVGYYRSSNKNSYKIVDGASGKIIGSRLKSAVTKLIVDN